MPAPDVQALHAVVAARAYNPVGQAVQPALVADGIQYVPSGQHTRVPAVVHWPYGVKPEHPVVVHDVMLAAYSPNS